MHASRLQLRNECHRLGPSVMSIAPEGDARFVRRHPLIDERPFVTRAEFRDSGDGPRSVRRSDHPCRRLRDRPGLTRWAPFGGAAFEIGDDEADIEAERQRCLSEILVRGPSHDMSHPIIQPAVRPRQRTAAAGHRLLDNLRLHLSNRTEGRGLVALSRGSMLTAAHHEASSP